MIQILLAALFFGIGYGATHMALDGIDAVARYFRQRRDAAAQADTLRRLMASRDN